MVKAGILPISTDFMTTLFSVIALVAITNTTLVAIVTQPRILYGMASEDVVPGVFAKIHPTRRSPWVGLLFSGVVVGCPARHRHAGHRRPGAASTWSSGWRWSPWCSCSPSTPW